MLELCAGAAMIKIQKIETLIESLLWRSRFVVFLAVLASLAVSLAMFYVATVDAYYLVSHLGDYASPGLGPADRDAARSQTIAHVVEIVDGYLLAIIMLLFSLGLYELFISKIQQAEGEETSSNVLVIHSLEDLKARLGKVVLLILVVKYFEHAIGLSYRNPTDLLYLSGGIVLISVALYLSHLGARGGE
jgi:uncharacterized membrane protein YqhA